MSNTIKLKRGSGSDPSASDLVVGELAIRTDSGKIFTKKDNGSVAEISGGGIDDGDKGDITVSNSGATFTIDNNAVGAVKIADGAIQTAKLADSAITNAKVASNAAIALSKLATGTLPSGLQVNHNNLQTGIIENENISSSAAIDGSKISPAFTSDITGTGDLTLTSTDAGSSAAPIIDLFRNSASPTDGDYLGQLKFRGEDSGGASTVYAKITGKIDDVTNGTEDGLIEFMTRKAGSNNICARLTGTTLKLLNGTGLEVDGDPSDAVSITSPKILSSNGIMEMKATISADHTLTSGYNAVSVDPAIADGITVTVPSGAVWSIV